MPKPTVPWPAPVPAPGTSNFVMVPLELRTKPWFTSFASIYHPVTDPSAVIPLTMVPWSGPVPAPGTANVVIRWCDRASACGNRAATSPVKRTKARALIRLMFASTATSIIELLDALNDARERLASKMLGARRPKRQCDIGKLEVTAAGDGYH